MELTPIFNDLALEWRSDPKLGPKGLFAVLSGVVAAAEAQGASQLGEGLTAVEMSATGTYEIVSDSVPSEGIPELVAPKARRRSPQKVKSDG